MILQKRLMKTLRITNRTPHLLQYRRLAALASAQEEQFSYSLLLALAEHEIFLQLFCVFTLCMS